MADELEVELIEVEMLESEIRRLKLQNQALSKEKEGLRSTVTSLEAADDDLIFRNQRLVEENEWLRSMLPELEKANENLQQEEEQSRRSIESLENRRRELTVEITVAEKQNEEYERRINRMIAEHEEVMLAMLRTQRVLEMELKDNDRIMESFHRNILMMVREMARMMEEGHVDCDDFNVSVPEGTHSAVKERLQSFALELTGVERAYMRVHRLTALMPIVLLFVFVWCLFLW